MLEATRPAKACGQVTHSGDLYKRTRAEEQGKHSAGNSGSRVSRGGAGGNGHLETPG
jgi:hypothetical protein